MNVAQELSHAAVVVTVGLGAMAEHVLPVANAVVKIGAVAVAAVSNTVAVDGAVVVGQIHSEVWQRRHKLALVFAMIFGSGDKDSLRQGHAIPSSYFPVLSSSHVLCVPLQDELQRQDSSDPKWDHFEFVSTAMTSLLELPVASEPELSSAGHDEMLKMSQANVDPWHSRQLSKNEAIL